LLIGAITSGGVVAAIWAAGGFQLAAIAPAFASDALIYIAVLLACFVVQASAEEILFRGWMLSALTRRINVVGAIAIVSAIFTLLHFGRDTTLLTLVNTVLFSVFACCWAVMARNVWGVMGWHAAWNWLLAVGFETRVTGLDAQVPALLARLTPLGPVDLTGGAEGPEGSLFCGLFFAGASALLVARRACRSEPERAAV
jgi:membrane protease YdiL (CAAX protease family)